MTEMPAAVDPRPVGTGPVLASPLTWGTSGLGEREEAVETAIAMLTGAEALVDTSNAYAGGRSEQTLGRALAALAPRAHRDIATKADRDLETGVLDRDRVLRSFEESITRLGVDRIGLFHLHDPYTIDFAQASAPGGAIEGMCELRDSGAVDAIGIAAGRLSVVAPYVRTGLFDAVLTHNRYTLVDRSALPLMEEARSLGMAVFNAAPFGGGMLARGPRPGDTYAYREAGDGLREWVGGAERVCVEHGTTLPAAALHFSLRSPLVTSTVVGAGRPARVAELERLRQDPPPESVWEALAALGSAPSWITD